MKIHGAVTHVVAITAFALLSGCASYRVDSNFTVEASQPGKSRPKVIISESDLFPRKYKEVGPVEVSVKKLTLFHKDPSVELVNAALVEKADAMGADAVVNVAYKSGIGFTTWGYMDAKGMCVKFTD